MPHIPDAIQYTRASREQEYYYEYQLIVGGEDNGRWNYRSVHNDGNPLEDFCYYGLHRFLDRGRTVVSNASTEMPTIDSKTTVEGHTYEYDYLPIFPDRLFLKVNVSDGTFYFPLEYVPKTTTASIDKVSPNKRKLIRS